MYSLHRISLNKMALYSNIALGCVRRHGRSVVNENFRIFHISSTSAMEQCHTYQHIWLISPTLDRLKTGFLLHMTTLKLRKLVAAWSIHYKFGILASSLTTWHLQKRWKKLNRQTLPIWNVQSEFWRLKLFF